MKNHIIHQNNNLKISLIDQSFSEKISQLYKNDRLKMALIISFLILFSFIGCLMVFKSGMIQSESVFSSISMQNYNLVKQQKTYSRFLSVKQISQKNLKFSFKFISKFNPFFHNSLNIFYGNNKDIEHFLVIFQNPNISFYSYVNLQLFDNNQIEKEQEDVIVKEENPTNNEQEISKAWEYFYILRQYLLILLLWVIVKFFDNGMIKKEGKYYLDIGFIMFTEGLAFGFLTCFGILSVIGFILSYVLTYNLKDSVEFAHSLDSLFTTMILWIFTFICIGYFSLTQKKKRGVIQKFILTLGILPSVILVFILPAQGMIILMN